MRAAIPAALLAVAAPGGCPTPTPPPTEAPAPEHVLVSVNGEAMYGVVQIDIRCPSVDQVVACRAAGDSAIGEVLRIGKMTDDWANKGELSKINAASGQAPIAISADTERMLNAAQTIAAASQGAFDVTIGALSRFWGIPGAQLPDQSVIDERLKLVDWRKLTVAGGEVSLADEGMSLTLGGVMKGYAADRAMLLIPPELDAKIDVGTDLLVRGQWEVEVPLPGAVERLAKVTVRDTALVTSGTYVPSPDGGGYFKTVVDPRTGRDAAGAAVGIVAHPQGVIADGLSTMLRVTGADAPAIEGLGAWALVMDVDGTVAEVGRRGAIVVDSVVPPIPEAPTAAPEGAGEAPTEGQPTDAEAPEGEAAKTEGEAAKTEGDAAKTPAEDKPAEAEAPAEDKPAEAEAPAEDKPAEAEAPTEDKPAEAEAPAAKD